MARILVVANRTLGGEHLVELLRDRAAAGDCSVHVVVPAGSDSHDWVHTEDEDVAAAQQRLTRAQERLSSLGVAVTGEVGDSRPVDAVLDALRRADYDEVVVSTLPAGPSRWLRADVVSRIERAIHGPVTHVVAAAESAATT